MPLENLVIHLWCGFALTYAGNLMTWDDQRCMRDLVVEAFQQIGGETPRGVLRWTAPIRRGAMP